MPEPQPEFKSLLPSNATDFERAMESIFRYNIYPVEDGKAYNPVGDAWNPERVPLHLIPYLGQNLGLTIDQNLTEAQQRMLLKCAWNLHQYAGTPHIILEAIQALGFPGASVDDGTASGTPVNGHWANFRIVLLQSMSVAEGQALIDLIEQLKPVRSVLVEIDITQAAHLWDGSILWDGSVTFGSIANSGIMT